MHVRSELPAPSRHRDQSSIHSSNTLHSGHQFHLRCDPKISESKPQHMAASENQTVFPSGYHASLITVRHLQISLIYILHRSPNDYATKRHPTVAAPVASDKNNLGGGGDGVT